MVVSKVNPKKWTLSVTVFMSDHSFNTRESEKPGRVSVKLKVKPVSKKLGLASEAICAF